MNEFSRLEFNIVKEYPFVVIRRWKDQVGICESWKEVVWVTIKDDDVAALEEAYFLWKLRKLQNLSL